MSDKTKSTVKLPSLYLDSKLFHRPCRDDRDTTNIGADQKAMAIPDPGLEPIKPDEDDSVSDTQKALSVLKMAKATPEEPDMTGRLEGKFKISVEEMIKQLNRIITAEYSEWMRWYHYALVLRGHARNALAEEFEKHAEDELGHLYKVGLRVIALGGYPSVKIDEIKELQDPDDIIKELIYREQEGIKLYREVLALCGDNEGTRQILESNIEAEQDHLDELWRWYKNPEMKKAGATQESGEGWMPMSQKQRRRQYEHSFRRDGPGGISGGRTPDTPEQGKDWHGTVPGVPDEPQDDEMQEELDRPPANLVDDKSDADAGAVLQDKNDEARKALAGAPRFSPGPFVTPRETQFLMERGWTKDQIESGQAVVPSRMRAQFNKWLTATVQKSITRLGS